MFELSQVVGNTPDLFASTLATSLTRILTLIIVAGVICVLVEAWVMKLCNWGSWRLCIADVVLLNFIASLSMFLLYTIAHNILHLPLPANPIAIVSIVIAIKSLVADKLSDRPWAIVLISNIASYLSFVIVLRCLFWFLLGFR